MHTLGGSLKSETLGPSVPHKQFSVGGYLLHFGFQCRIDIFTDCCDGSDEYEGKARCPNTCIMGGNLQYKPENYVTKASHVVDIEGSKSEINNSDYMTQKLKGARSNFLLQTRNKSSNFSAV